MAGNAGIRQQMVYVKLVIEQRRKTDDDLQAVSMKQSRPIEARRRRSLEPGCAARLGRTRVVTVLVPEPARYATTASTTTMAGRVRPVTSAISSARCGHTGVWNARLAAASWIAERRRHRRGCLVDDRSQRCRLPLQGHPMRVDLAEVQDVVDEM